MNESCLHWSWTFESNCDDQRTSLSRSWLDTLTPGKELLKIIELVLPPKLHPADLPAKATWTLHHIHLPITYPSHLLISYPSPT